MPDVPTTMRQLRSLVTPERELRLSVATVDVPQPGERGVVVRVGCSAYSWVRSYARGDRYTAEDHGHQVLAAERFLHIDIEHGLNRLVADTPWLADGMDFYYSAFHFAVPLTILGWLLVTRPAGYRAARRWLCLTTLFGLVGFWLYPLAPPRLMPGLG